MDDNALLSDMKQHKNTPLKITLNNEIHDELFYALCTCGKKGGIKYTFHLIVLWLSKTQGQKMQKIQYYFAYDILQTNYQYWHNVWNRSLLWIRNFAKY